MGVVEVGVGLGGTIIYMTGLEHNNVKPSKTGVTANVFIINIILIMLFNQLKIAAILHCHDAMWVYTTVMSCSAYPQIKLQVYRTLQLKCAGILPGYAQLFVHCDI